MPRRIDDLLSTFFIIVAAFCFLSHLILMVFPHVNCHAVPFNLILKLKDGLPSYLSGRREDVDVELADFNGLMSCLILPHILGNHPGKRSGKSLGDTIKNAHHDNSSTSEIQIKRQRCSTITPETIWKETCFRVSQNP